jgi:hypothetical protein
MALQQNRPSLGTYPPVSIENILSSVHPKFFYTDKNSVLIEEDEEIIGRYTVKMFCDSIYYTLQYNAGI